MLTFSPYIFPSAISFLWHVFPSSSIDALSCCLNWNDCCTLLFAWWPQVSSHAFCPSPFLLHVLPLSSIDKLSCCLKWNSHCTLLSTFSPEDWKSQVVSSAVCHTFSVLHNFKLKEHSMLSFYSLIKYIIHRPFISGLSTYSFMAPPLPLPSVGIYV